jgi:SAM-dependent methyltransferase
VLGPLVAQLSASYNAEAGEAPLNALELLPARLAFSLPRDVPKMREAVRELVAAGLLTRPRLRVLDLGAGLGASTFGLWEALGGAESTTQIEALLCDSDAEALRLAERVAAAWSKAGPAPQVRTRKHTLGQPIPKGPYDVILLGQVLSEDARDADDATRRRRHAELIRSALRELADDGSLIIVEPALRTRTRHLHALRDALVAECTVFAPCLHQQACGALRRPGDWCHEDLPIDLPEWLVPVARSAGLRYQGLTFSYLVLRKDGKTLAAELTRVSGAPTPLRVVSKLLKSKGKTEVFLCGGEAGEFATWLRTSREAAATNAAWDDLGRGDIIAIAGEVPRTGRIGVDTTVSRLQGFATGREQPADAS